jgi:hypothetical protein
MTFGTMISQKDEYVHEVPSEQVYVPLRVTSAWYAPSTNGDVGADVSRRRRRMLPAIIGVGHIVARREDRMFS